MTDQYSQLAAEYAGKEQGYYEMGRQELLPYVPREVGSVLDVGCSSGAFGAALKAERPKIEVWGIEPHTEFAAVAGKKLDVVINSLFEKDLPELNGRTFDLICFNDVLEHVAAPEVMLEASKPFLSEKGLVLASIPNILYWPVVYQLLKLQDFKYEGSGVLDRTHLRFFTKKSILRMFEECGFVVERIEGINPNMFWKYKLLNGVFANKLYDWRFIQFAITARPR